MALQLLSRLRFYKREICFIVSTELTTRFKQGMTKIIIANCDITYPTWVWKSSSRRVCSQMYYFKKRCNMAVFRYVALCSLEMYWHFRGSCWFHHQGDNRDRINIFLYLNICCYMNVWTRSFALGNTKLSVFEKKIFKRTFGPKRN